MVYSFMLLVHGVKFTQVIEIIERILFHTENYSYLDIGVDNAKGKRDHIGSDRRDSGL